MAINGRMLCICFMLLPKPPQTGVNITMAHSTSTSPLGLTISQAAQELGVSLGTIRRWSDMGYLESYRTPGRQCLYVASFELRPDHPAQLTNRFERAHPSPVGVTGG